MNTCINTNGWKEARVKSTLYANAQKKLRIESYNNNPCICVGCGVELDYAKRTCKFCSSSCAATFNNRSRNSKIKSRLHRGQCLSCGHDVISSNKHAKYCSRKCVYDSIYKESIDKLMKGTLKELNKRHRDYIIQLRGSQCEACGISPINPYTNRSTLNVDHIDGKSVNNTLDNLRVLCPTCHSLTPTYGALNKGNCTRPYRYKKKER